MSFNPAIWRPIAIIVSLLNVGGLVMALGAGEPAHAAGHVLVGVALVAWFRRMGERAREDTTESIGGDRQAQIEGLEFEVDQLRRELTEAQERLDFTERMMAKRR